MGGGGNGRGGAKVWTGAAATMAAADPARPASAAGPADPSSGRSDTPGRTLNAAYGGVDALVATRRLAGGVGGVGGPYSQTGRSGRRGGGRKGSNSGTDEGRK